MPSVAPFTNMDLVIAYPVAKVWDEISCRFPNFNDATVDFWE